MSKIRFVVEPAMVVRKPDIGVEEPGPHTICNVLSLDDTRSFGIP